MCVCVLGLCLVSVSLTQHISDGLVVLKRGHASIPLPGFFFFFFFFFSFLLFIFLFQELMCLFTLLSWGVLSLSLFSLLSFIHPPIARVCLLFVALSHKKWKKKRKKKEKRKRNVWYKSMPMPENRRGKKQQKKVRQGTTPTNPTYQFEPSLDR